MLKQAASDWWEDKAMRLSASLAMYSTLSLAPLLIVTIKILALLYGESTASRQVDRQLRQLIGPTAAEAVNSMVVRAGTPGTGLVATVVSLTILVISASWVFGELQDALNTIWKVKPRPHRGWWIIIRERLLSIAMVFVIAFLLLISQFIGTALTIMSEAATGGPGWASIVVDLIVSTAVITVLFAMLFRFLPDVRIGWREVFLGAVVSAVLFKIGQYILALYFTYSAPTSIYGAAGTFVAVLLWVYYSAWILFFGAELTQAYGRRGGRRIRPARSAIHVTEEERARQGIVPTARLEALAQQPASSEASASRTPHRPRRTLPGHSRRTAGYAWAAGALAVGYLIGRLAAHRRPRSGIG